MNAHQNFIEAKNLFWHNGITSFTGQGINKKFLFRPWSTQFFGTLARGPVNEVISYIFYYSPLKCMHVYDYFYK